MAPHHQRPVMLTTREGITLSQEGGSAEEERMPGVKDGRKKRNPRIGKPSILADMGEAPGSPGFGSNHGRKSPLTSGWPHSVFHTNRATGSIHCKRKLSCGRKRPGAILLLVGSKLHDGLGLRVRFYFWNNWPFRNLCNLCHCDFLIPLPRRYYVMDGKPKGIPPCS